MSEHKNIFEALNAVMKEVGYVQKKKGEKLGYTYAGEAELIAAIRPHLVDHGIVVVPAGVRDLRTESYETKGGTTMNRTIGIFSYAFVHGASDTKHIVEVMGEGSDAGDKSANKAMTIAYKYALRQALMIETGDDPDSEASGPQERASKPSQRPATGPTGGKPSGVPQHQPSAWKPEDNGHWIDDPEIRRRFWAFAKERGLSEADVHAALSVEHVHEYSGTMGDAKTRLTEYAQKVA